MPVKDVNRIPEYRARFNKVSASTIEVGILGDKFLAMIGAVNEFGKVIKPKRKKWLAIPVHKNTVGRRPRDFEGLRFVKANDNTAFFFMGDKKYFLLKKSVRIPERSFIRKSFDSKRNQNKVFRIAEGIFDLRKSRTDLLDQMGLTMAALIQKRIRSNISPANSPLTRQNKGGKSKTLVNTGRLIQGITHKVT